MISSMKANSKKIISKILIIAFIFAMIPFSSACGVPGRIKREAEEYKNQHEAAFRKKVEDELGPDYKLTDVEGVISDTSLRGEPRINRYVVSPSLKGKVEYNGETYDIEYYPLTDKISTDALYPEIIDDLATTLGLDKSKIIFKDLVASIEFKHVNLPSNIRTVETFLRSLHGSKWFFIIVTSEDISDKKYYDLSPLLYELKMEELPVEIYSSDNVTDLDHLKKNYGKIAWRTATTFNKNKRLELPDYMEGEKDVFTRYNFKNAARINYYPYGMEVLSY